ncbi:MAG TPA: ATP-binding protein [Anaeromyxobacteraceae bacterium]|nr:ATP-binding protein [Anaeromyxobacteraceae bacterium]
MAVRSLSPEDLCRRCDPSRLPFQTTADLGDLDLPLGQDRAAEALRFGTAIRQDGYNIFALGPPGVGKETLVSRVVRQRAAGEKPPSDWCYLYNFEDRHRPRAVELPAGRALQFRADMQKLVEELRVAIPAVFEGEEYRTRLSVLEKQLEEKREEAMRRVQEHAREKGVAMVRTPMGIALAPTREGEVLDPEQFRQLPSEQQQRLQKDIAALQEELGAVLRSVPQLERDHRERVKDMNKEVALFAVGHLIDDLRGRYADLPPVLAHLDAVQRDVVENVHDFLAGGEAEDAASQIRKLLAETPSLHRYGVNVMVDHSGAAGAPVVTEDLPTHPNLVGRIEHHAHFGTLVTDFTLIRPGALHRANGGYLVLDARKVLTQPFAWDDLKRALRAREIRIEPPERLVGLSGAASLDPEPIPLQVKVVLTGERFLYHLLAAYDPDFLELFKVAADFEDQVDRTPGNELSYARLVATLARAGKLRPFDREAVARVVERAARLAGDGEKLSAHLQGIADLLREANHLAGEAGRETVGRADVQAAIDGQVRRADRVRQRLQEEIGRGTILIDTRGATVGQVNGLSVYQLGQFAFGSPSRITARVRMGKGEVVDIEREVELGGPIHSKGVLILAGFLGARYAADRPLTLSASLVFEQSYSGVEGDSASSAELYALLSALAGLPVRQSIAVTGSVNQLGEVQAIGGVNEKVEGFFDVCRARGLDGSQGVLLPASNVKHLMLREDVVEAVRADQFHLWAVENVDQGIEVLTGVPAGGRGPDGRWPEGTVNARVAARVAEMAERARAFAVPPRAEEPAGERQP